MKSPQPASAHLFWPGVAVGVAFRIFAYGLLWQTFLFQSRFQSHSILLAAFKFLWVFYLASVFAVPFIAGILSAYFWRRIETQHHMKAICLSTSLFFLLLTAFVLATWKGRGLENEILLFALDVGGCALGVDQGREFWRGSLAHQLFGNFLQGDAEDFNKL